MWQRPSPSTSGECATSEAQHKAEASPLTRRSLLPPYPPPPVLFPILELAFPLDHWCKDHPWPLCERLWPHVAQQANHIRIQCLTYCMLEGHIWSQRSLYAGEEKKSRADMSPANPLSYSWESPAFGMRTTWACVLTLPRVIHVTLGKSLKLEPPFFK